jgi:hypothetical protein
MNFEPLALAVFQAFSLVKPRISRLLSQKLKFWKGISFIAYFGKLVKRAGDKSRYYSMNKKINFEDSIFIINVRIRMIQDMLLLEADPDLFLEKTLDDVDFIDKTLTILHEQLSNSKRFIERREQFRNLAETERFFADVLGGIISGDGFIFPDKFPAVRDRLTLLRNRARERRNTIDNMADSEDGGPSMEPVVGPEELKELLQNFL